MKEFWIATLGGLVGSLGTVIATKIFDVIQQKKQHIYGLEKSFFDKKLVAAESAVIQYTVLSNALINLSVLFEQLTKEYGEFENYLQDSMLQESLKQLELANNNSLLAAASLDLYFDFENKFNAGKILSELFKVLHELGDAMQVSNNKFDVYMSLAGKPGIDFAYHEYEKAKAGFHQHLLIISRNYRDYTRKIRKVINEIRREMVVYDYPI